MSLIDVLILIAFAVTGFLLNLIPFTRKFRLNYLLIASIGIIFWLQPGLPIRGLDFWLPTATILIAALGWWLTSRSQDRDLRATLLTSLQIAAEVLIIALTRYFSSSGVITPSRPPQLYLVVILLAVSGVIFYWLSRTRETRSTFLAAAIFALIVLFVGLKLPALTQWVSSALRGLTGQSRELASALDIRWLGYSYIAFRLIHTLRDRQTGHLPAMRLDEYLVYMLFFPSFNAGPIDRAERFISQLRTAELPSPRQLEAGLSRLVVGLFKKFVLADTLALIALNGTNAYQIEGLGWYWLLLYAYSFQIFFDFSGYTDLAIGMGLLLGIRLPENFNHPYLKPNLTRFWDSWHMSLTQWFRAYFFNPVTRFLRTKARSLPAWVVILITQLATMTLIGLWHGITLNFVFWGIWHGLGLFINNRWSNATRHLAARIKARPWLDHGLTVFSTLLTFHYVALGWVWFALPDPTTSLRVFTGLLGGVGAP